MAVALVERVEAVEIDHHDRERRRVARRAAALGREQVERVAAIRDAGERVDAHQPLEIVVRARELRDRVGQLALARALPGLAAVRPPRRLQPRHQLRSPHRARHAVARTGAQRAPSPSADATTTTGTGRTRLVTCASACSSARSSGSELDDRDLDVGVAVDARERLVDRRHDDRVAVTGVVQRVSRQLGSERRGR